jgi:hypothetical protein
VADVSEDGHVEKGYVVVEKEREGKMKRRKMRRSR